MKGPVARLVSTWVMMGPRYLPFADIATPDLPLSRLLRLSLFQVSVGMALVLLLGTLNRVMIVELNVPASLVGIMLALPLVFAPFRALIGFKSDTHQCALGWRRVPYIWRGSMLQFAGFAIMPFALLVLAGEGKADTLPVWIGLFAAGCAFLLVGAGLHTIQTAGLALATDLTPPKSHAKVVGLMYVMLLLGMIVSSTIFGIVLNDFSNGRLIRVIQGAAVLTLILNVAAMWKQEQRHVQTLSPNSDLTFAQSWANFCSGPNSYRRLAIVGLGTMAFSMADIILEPFGGQILDLTVATTTKLTAVLAAGGLIGFSLASYAMRGDREPYIVARAGAILGIPSFALIIIAGSSDMPILFVAGNFLIGFSGALFGHGTLTATMNRAPAEQAGLALGAWGAVQATAAGVAMALSGVLRDVVNAIIGSGESIWWGLPGAASGYLAVYGTEIALLLVTVLIMLPLVKQASLDSPRQNPQTQIQATSASRLGE